MADKRDYKISNIEKLGLIMQIHDAAVALLRANGGRDIKFVSEDRVLFGDAHGSIVNRRAVGGGDADE